MLSTQTAALVLAGTRATRLSSTSTNWLTAVARDRRRRHEPIARLQNAANLFARTGTRLFALLTTGKAVLN